ncbi:type II toxin-antitoxin system VapC family toxin [Paracidobacterium acidisoli]|uniref:Ribonuclease VapC n=1 Tax=Paracidobacterium acidisoli TaxID=2303751 RepID=A0A372IRB3_9BACT|nr:type II toxin-antitoxin system VapC family toxin [Paracidobacterium acidisoli]MBT9330165.1 type II toxin-antitoxin system VapC family toxin [Paracidobacterium acidisoli]
MILLDTHVVVWLLGSPGRLSQLAKDAIKEAHQRKAVIAVSSQSLYETARGVVRGRIQTHIPVEVFLREIESRFSVLPLTREIALLAASFPSPFPGDPADRIIAATALAEGFSLVTADENIRRSGLVRIIW